MPECEHVCVAAMCIVGMQNASAMLGAVTVLPEAFLVLAFANTDASDLCAQGARLLCSFL